MATKFGYVERNIENDVNWGEVGRGFADMLVAEREERKAKKQFLDDAMAETQDALKQAPLGYNTDFNDRIIELSTNASAYLLAANKDMKAGKITPAEYMRKVQRLNSSADQIFTLTNNYNKLYEEHLNRLDKGVSGEVEQAIFERIDNMTNFNSHDFFIDSTGAIVAAPLVTGKDGVTTIDPSKALSAQAMFNLAQNFVNKLDVEGEVDSAVKKLGAYATSEAQTASRKAGGQTVTISDISKRDDYQDMRESLINGILDSDLNTASVLSDYIRGYEVITDENQLSKDPAEREKQVFIDISNGKEGRAVLTKKQEEAAIKQVGTLIDGMIDRTYGVTTTPKVEASWAEKQFWWNQSQNNKQNQRSLNQLALLYAGGSEEEVKAAIQYFKGLSKGKIHDIIRTDNDVTVVYKDSTGKLKRTSPLSYGDSFVTFAKTATALTGIKDSGKAMESVDLSGLNIFLDENGMPIFQSYETSISLPDVITGLTPPKIDYTQGYGPYLNKTITQENKDSMIPILATLGITAQADEKNPDKIQIVEKTASGEKVLGPKYDLNDPISLNMLKTYLERSNVAKTKFSSGAQTTTGVGAGDDLF